MKSSFILGLLLLSGIMHSCMKDKPEEFPQKLVWNPELAVPIGIDSFGMNAESGFDTTLFETNPLTGLPLWVDERVIIMERNMEFDLNSVDEYIDSVDQVLFRLNLSNGFPEEAMTQAYFLNSENEAIDSMFSEGPLPVRGGTPIGEGADINPSLVRKDVTFSSERIKPLEEAIEIIFRTVLSNQEIDSTLIPYYPAYSFEIEIGMMADFSLEF